MGGGEAKSGDGFYVGYRALPARHRAFLLVAVPLAVLGMVVGAWGLAAGQPAWGDGHWETGAAREFRGTLSLEPYPMLHVGGADLGGSGSVSSYLLVEMGKFGSADRFAEAAGLDGATVSVMGRELRRNGRLMIEIDPASDGEGSDGDGPARSGVGGAVSVLPSDRPAVRVGVSVGGSVGGAAGGEAVTLVGEVVDSKCYLGAMKPGAGRGHRACARLCVAGGIPPVLVVRDGGGAASYLLLTDAAGRGLRGSGLGAIEPMIGERVELRGVRGRVGSWETLRLEPGAAEGRPPG